MGTLPGVIGHPQDVADEDQRTKDLAEVVQVGRDALTQEFQISERLDAKARGHVTLAGQWFAVVQAVAAVAFAARGIDDGWLLAVAATAAAGGIALATTVVLSWRVWRIRDEEAVSPKGLLEMKEEAEREESEALEPLVRHYASKLQSRRGTNRTRADALAWAERVWFVAMALPLVELVLALYARLFG